MTNDPKWKKRYSITLYQDGWRLGGKCATGRNKQEGNRIEEHGLHILLGFYHNTFGMIRRCYYELYEDWRPYFLPEDSIVFDEFVDSRLDPWVLRFPPADGAPGDAFFPWMQGEPHEGYAWSFGKSLGQEEDEAEAAARAAQSAQAAERAAAEAAEEAAAAEKAADAAAAEAEAKAAAEARAAEAEREAQRAAEALAARAPAARAAQAEREAQRAAQAEREVQTQTAARETAAREAVEAAARAATAERVAAEKGAEAAKAAAEAKARQQQAERRARNYDREIDASVEGSGEAWSYVPRILAWMRQFLMHPPSASDTRSDDPLWDAPLETGWLARAVVDRVRLLRHVGYAGLLEILDKAINTAHKLTLAPNQRRHDDRSSLLGYVKRFKQELNERVRKEAVADTAAGRVWAQLDFWLTIVNGILTDDVARNGFDQLDECDFGEWFASHSALGIVGHDSPYLRATYGVVFGINSGDNGAPQLAAGTALRGLLRMTFGYEGHVGYRMRLGIGDTVIAPLYRVLKQRGVRFKFFHRVETLKVGGKSRPGQRWIEEVVLRQQAKPAKGDDTYDPLIDVGGHLCWPREPLYDQLEEGPADPSDGPAAGEGRTQPGSGGGSVEGPGRAPRLPDYDLESSAVPWRGGQEVILKRGEDFHDVVLAIPIGALKHEGICEELVAVTDVEGTGVVGEDGKRWGAMLERVETQPTQAFQLWLRPSLEELGWRQWDAPNPIITTYGRPVDTVADMSAVLPAEEWPAADAPKSLFYFCGVIPKQDGRVAELLEQVKDDPKKLRRAKEVLVKTEADRFWRVFADGIWPRWRECGSPPAGWSSSGGQAAWEGGVKQLTERLVRSEYYRANIEPWQEYVLSVPGSTKFRLASDDSRFRNLYLAGDWTWNGMNAGCVEGAVMSGLLAARAITGRPQVIIGEPPVHLRPLPDQPVPQDQPAPGVQPPPLPPEAGGALGALLRRPGGDPGALVGILGGGGPSPTRDRYVLPAARPLAPAPGFRPVRFTGESRQRSTRRRSDGDRSSRYSGNAQS
jgi:uncharacterized protein with NAD-binding domain and iron-sulfur cluster